MSKPLLALLEALPRHAEEGGFSTLVPRESLAAALCSVGDDPAAAGAVVAVIERLFSTLGLLDGAAQESGGWRFVSFPAQLLARSILESLADKRQRLFPPGFWLGDAAPGVREQQRKILHDLETSRLRHHPDGAAAPVRRVYVAWAFIRLDDRILFHHREDKHRPEVSNHVPIGGRLHIQDFSQPADAVLARWEDLPGDWLAPALEKTLVREMEEETGLLAERDYHPIPWLELRPFRQIEGAGANHAFTEYRITVFSVTLTRAGFFRLLETVAENDELVWFSVSDIASGAPANGKTVYVDALRADPGALQCALEGLPQGFAEPYRFRDAVEFGLENLPITRGETGKETEWGHSLRPEAKSLLWALAWHGKGLPFQSTVPGVALLPHGWIAVSDECLRGALLELAATLAALGFPLLDVEQERGFRLSLAPECVHFASGLFRAGIREKNLRPVLELSLPEALTPLGSTAAESRTAELPERVAEALRKVLEHEVYAHEQENLPRQIRRIEEDLRPLGFRKLLRTVNGRLRFAVRFPEG